MQNKFGPFKFFCVLCAFFFASGEGFAVGKVTANIKPAVTLLPAPQPHKVKGFDKAQCVDVDKAIRLCKGIGEAGAIFLVERGGERLGSWPATDFMGDAGAFEVLRADLDNDGRPELIVANHDGASNGLGERYWTIAVVPLPVGEKFKSPLMFSVEEYGRNGTFVGDAVTGRIDILAGFWSYTEKPYRGRSAGTYFCGRWFGYRGGELYPISGRPILARRYLLSFEKERWADIDSPEIPLSWLSDKRTEKRRLDPAIESAPASTKTGVIESFDRFQKSSGPDDPVVTIPGIHIKVKFADGTSATLTNFVGRDEATPETFDSIGDLDSGQLYPDNYILAEDDGRWSGKKIRVSRYGKAGGENGEFVVLWVSSGN